MSASVGSGVTWLRSGGDGLAAMLEAIDHARHSVALEMYIFQASEVGDRFRTALANAARRGVRVRVLVDAVGSLELSASYLQPIVDAGGEFRWFNPLALHRWPYRDHRKVLVVDDEVAVIGGFNIAPEYDGDGVTSGWHDLGMVIRGELIAGIAKAVHSMFGAASFRHRRLSRFRRPLQQQRVTRGSMDLLLLSPGRGRNPARDSLLEDLRRSKRVALTTAYFLAPRNLRRAMVAAARRGAQVQLLLPGKCDVRLAQLAARGQYASLLRGGVEIFEYQPTVLHAKRYLMDDHVYVGSANLDHRSLDINYELLLRIHDPVLAEEGRAHFAADLARSHPVTRESWARRPWWNRWAERLASAILVRLDLRFAMRQLTWLRRASSSRSLRHMD